MLSHTLAGLQSCPCSLRHIQHERPDVALLLVDRPACSNIFETSGSSSELAVYAHACSECETELSKGISQEASNAGAARVYNCLEQHFELIHRHNTVQQFFPSFPERLGLKLHFFKASRTEESGPKCHSDLEAGYEAHASRS